MKKYLFKGCGTALVTPFSDDGIINFEQMRKLIDFQILEGVDAIIVCGTTGESSTLSLEEKKSLIDFCVKIIRKRVPLIAGTGGNNTKDVIELSKYASKVGADGLLIVTPYYNKSSNEGLIKHYTAICEHTLLPIILYNVPSRTGVNLNPVLCLELSKLPNIIGIKEASGNLSQVAQIASLCPKDFYIYSGNDDQILPTLSLGGIGVISVVSNIYPKYIHNLVFEYLNGDFALSKIKQLKMIDLINSLFIDVNPIPIKYAMNVLGFNVGALRLPLYELCNDKKELVAKSIIKFKNNTKS